MVTLIPMAGLVGVPSSRVPAPVVAPTVEPLGGTGVPTAGPVRGTAVPAAGLVRGTAVPAARVRTDVDGHDVVVTAVDVLPLPRGAPV